MSNSQKNPLEGKWSKMVPELSVSDISKSLSFWCEVLGFNIVYERPENGFAYLEREGSQFMLDQENGNWSVGALEAPYGRGINFQIECSSVKPILESLTKAEHPLFREVHDAWYRADDIEVGCRQFLVQDPDGYLLRFSEDLGDRSIEK